MTKKLLHKQVEKGEKSMKQISNSEVLEKVTLTLINKKNVYGNEVIKWDFTNELAIICHYPIDEELHNMIDENELKEIGITKDELFTKAMNNTINKRPLKIEPFKSALGPDFPLYGFEDIWQILSSEEGFYGATCIIYPEVLDKYPDETIFIPSSIHEWIVVPPLPDDYEDKDSAYKNFTQMVRMVNASCLHESDILADYSFVKKNGKLVAAG